jgi:hypothetical protein
MGNCKCEIHFHENEGEANIDDIKGSQAINSNRPVEIISQYSQVTAREKGTKLNKMKNNLKQKLPELGNYISITEYRNLLNEDISNYMETKKLNINNYITPNLSTFKSEPIQFKNNNVYYGNWNEKSQMEGYGVYYIKDRKVITEGVWIEGNIVFGRIFFPNGDIYEGEMKNSVPEGKGKFLFANGENYEGDFKKGEMTGEGIFRFSDKTEYKGSIENGIFNGKGSMTWENGTQYNGNFIDSSLCGNGTITNIQKEKYEGNFDKNEFNGYGTYYFNNGDEYEGNFEYGIKRGKGIYRRNDKVIFEGIWNDDLPNGNGIIKYGGNILKGFWRNGIFVGNSEIEEGNIEIFDNIDKDIKPYKISIIPSSLSHLAIADSNASQFIPGKDINFI